jgi:hypothetical protein
MYSVSLAGSGDLVMDNFETEEDAYVWLRFQYGYDSPPESEDVWFEGFVIEPSEEAGSMASGFDWMRFKNEDTGFDGFGTGFEPS